MLNRRNFITTLIRSFVLLSIAIMSGFFIFREENNSESCEFNFICRNCKKLRACNKPEADNFKQKLTNKRNAVKNKASNKSN